MDLIHALQLAVRELAQDIAQLHIRINQLEAKTGRVEGLAIWARENIINSQPDDIGI